MKNQAQDLVYKVGLHSVYVQKINRRLINYTGIADIEYGN